MPISLSDAELAALMTAAQPFAPERRDAFLQQVAKALQGCRELRPGTVHKAIREAQRAHFDPPILNTAGHKPPRRWPPR
jgi:hypothetical protein